MYCVHCGTGLPEEARFCYSCGQQLDPSERATDARSGPPAPPPPPLPAHSPVSNTSRPGVVCPQCLQNDAIQKVSATFSAGVSKSSYSGPTVGLSVGLNSGGELRPRLGGGFTSLSGGSQTSLSARLAPPVYPEYKLPWPKALFWLVAPVIVFPLFVILPFFGPFRRWFKVYAPVALGVVVLAFSAITKIDDEMIRGGRSAYEAGTELQQLLTIVFGLVVFSYPLLYYVAFATEHSSRARRAEAERPRWAALMRVWDTFYYCSRNDCVFIPGVECVPVEGMNALLSSKVRS